MNYDLYPATTYVSFGGKLRAYRRTFYRILKMKKATNSAAFSAICFLFRRNVFPDSADLDVYDLKTDKIIFTTEFSEWDNYGMNISGGRFLNYQSMVKKRRFTEKLSAGRKMETRRFRHQLAANQKIKFATRKEISVGNLRCVNVQ